MQSCRDIYILIKNNYLDVTLNNMDVFFIYLNSYINDNICIFDKEDLFDLNTQLLTEVYYNNLSRNNITTFNIYIDSYQDRYDEFYNPEVGIISYIVYIGLFSLVFIGIFGFLRFRKKNYVMSRVFL